MCECEGAFAHSAIQFHCSLYVQPTESDSTHTHNEIAYKLLRGDIFALYYPQYEWKMEFNNAAHSTLRLLPLLTEAMLPWIDYYVLSSSSQRARTQNEERRRKEDENKKNKRVCRETNTKINKDKTKNNTKIDFISLSHSSSSVCRRLS